MKFIKQLKLLTLQVILSLVLLNTQLSFAQSKFDGSYIGANLGIVRGSADFKEINVYNDSNIGLYEPNGNIFGLYGGYNISFNKAYFIGFEASLNRLEISKDKQLPAFVGVRPDDSVAMTSSGYYFSPEVKVGVLLSQNSNYYISAGKVFSSIKQSFRDNNATGLTLVPAAETDNLSGNSIGFGFEFLENNNIYRADFSKMNFGRRNMSTLSNDGDRYEFSDTLSLNILTIGFAKKF